MAVPPTDKSDLRRSLRTARQAFVAALKPAERARLEASLSNILDCHLPPGRTAGYAAIGSEIGVHNFGRPLLYPRVAAGYLTFHELAYDALQPGFANIPEPMASAPAVVPQVVLVPLLGIDRSGNRLGQGAGYYDRTLAALDDSVLAVGVAWDMQLVEHLPIDPWDVPLAALATPTAWTRFRA